MCLSLCCSVLYIPDCDGTDALLFRSVSFLHPIHVYNSLLCFASLCSNAKFRYYFSVKFLIHIELKFHAIKPNSSASFFQMNSTAILLPNTFSTRWLFEWRFDVETHIETFATLTPKLLLSTAPHSIGHLSKWWRVCCSQTSLQCCQSVCACELVK